MMGMKNLNNKSKKIVVSGYYGCFNFGDEAILKVLSQHLLEKGHSVTVLSSNPKLTADQYNVKSVFKFDFINVVLSILFSDILISGGGSLLQDKTSIKSIFYYLAVIFIALVLQKKVIIFAQGIGPINSFIAKFLTSKILKKCHLVTVRDIKSQELLESLGVESILISDPVFSLELPFNTPMNRVGIQLRYFNGINDQFLEKLALIINKYFSHKEIYIYSFQDNLDSKICQMFMNILFNINSKLRVKFQSNLSVDEVISDIRNLDYMISMRYHGCLIGAKYGIRTLALVYDPKVENLATSLDLPMIDARKSDINFEEVFSKLISMDRRILIGKVSEQKFSFDIFDDFLEN